MRATFDRDFFLAFVEKLKLKLGGWAIERTQKVSTQISSIIVKVAPKRVVETRLDRL